MEDTTATEETAPAAAPATAGSQKRTATAAAASGQKKKRRKRPKKKRGGQRGSRATEGGRKIPPILGGDRHRIYRMKDPNDPDKFVRYDGNTKNVKLIDSLVHRYNREVGFHGTASEKEKEEVENHKLLQETLEEANGVEYRPKSARDRATVQSYFECYILEKFPNSEYARFLREIRKCDKTGEKVIFQQPFGTLVLNYIQYLRRKTTDSEGTPGRSQKVSAIDTALKCLSGTSIECGGGRIPRTVEIKKYMLQWEDEDETARAEAFDPVDILPKAWDVVWSLEYLNHETKCTLWARLLLQLGTIGRSSDVCTSKDQNYCPMMKDVEFPTNPQDWTDEGLPTYVELTWKAWKGRKRGCRGKPYKIRLYHNPFDFRFCPIHWLLSDWEYRRNAPGFMDGPILRPVSAKTYQDQLRLIFDELGVCCTSHSLRRTAAQWAARCGADILVIQNVGRWESLKHLSTYVSEGVAFRNKMKEDHGNVDPIYQFWVFNKKSSLSSMAMTGEQLVAAA